MALFLNVDRYPAEFALHKKYATTETLLELVWNHSQIILDIALTLHKTGLFDTTDLPENWVEKAILLHDIGVYVCGGFEWIPGQPLTEKSYAYHTAAGGAILQQEGYCDHLIRVAQIHTGVGLSEEEIRKYGMDLPPGDYTPVSNLEWFVTYSSKFHSKTPKFRTSEEIIQSLTKYGPEKVERFQQLQAFFGTPDIPAFEKKYEDWHKGFAYTIKQLQESGTRLAAGFATTNLNPAGISVQH